MGSVRTNAAGTPLDEITQPQTAPEGAPNVTALAGIDLSDANTFSRGVPHEAYDVLRRVAPVAWQDEKEPVRRVSELSTGIPAPYSPGYWAVTGHALVEEISKHPEQFSSWLGGSQLYTANPVSLANQRLMMLNMDPPDQVRLRKVVSPSFSTHSVRLLVDYVNEQAQLIADSLAGTQVVNFVETVSKRLTANVLARILGMPEEDAHLIVRWSDVLIGFEVGDPQELMAAQLELVGYGQRVLLEKRASIGTDLVAQIAHTEIDGERLSDDEFRSFWILLVIAGNETTRNSLSGAVAELARSGKWAELAKDPEQLTPVAVEELIRFVTPVMQFRRTATSDVELGGQLVRAGDKVVMYYSAANRDPAVFERPHELDLTRDPNPHLAFGVGPHFCLGTRVARLQLTAMLKELLKRYPDLRVDGEIEYTKSSFIAGVNRLPIRVD